jgi:succinate dehydrogenase subunit C
MAHIAEHYTEYHPRWLRPHISTYWWLRKRSYFAFILREISSLFVAWAAVYVLLIVHATARGPAEYAALLEWARQPWVLIVNVCSLLLVGFHAVTWFNLAPQAIVVRFGHSHVPGVLIAASNYAAWVVLSAILAWLLIGG